MPELLFGVNLPIDKAMTLIFDCLQKVVPQIPNAALNNVIGTSMIIGCANAAKMDTVPKATKHIALFLLVPILRFLVEKCGMYTSCCR